MVYIKFFVYRQIWFLWLIGLAIFCFAVVKQINWQTAGSVAAALLGFFYFIQKQKLEEFTVFHKLFKEFNERYDKLNSDIYSITIKNENDPLTNEEIVVLYDYFNLCGEEYLYYSQGLIIPEVWNAWEKGMILNLKHPRISKLWVREKKTGSYYDLDL